MARKDAGRLRDEMVERQIASRGVDAQPVLAAMRSVPRHRFVPDIALRDAYADRPLPIGSGQTISQPYVVALMAQELQLEDGDRVFEIGTGCGYAAAVLGRIASEVWTIERHPQLAHQAHDLLVELGYDNVHVLVGDGTTGYPEAAPYDAIVAAAAGPRVPDALLDQLAEGGRLVMPVGGSGAQQLVRVRRRDDGFEHEQLGGVRFVPLIGEQGAAAE
jgi:protein-L-isoaspartate(D-aspartate) O-methyltransferase